MYLDCAGRRLDLSRPAVMGILNVTSDSFSEGGRFLDLDAALAHATAMIDAGATLIDIGGESTRPGAAPVPLQQELDRVLPVIERLRDRTDAILSIDTMKPEVMRAAVRAGAGLVNDVMGLRADGAVAAVAEGDAAVCLMHMQGEPRTMQQHPHYDDVVTEVRDFLRTRVHACVAAGIPSERIAVDPGFGFGKTAAHNLTLLRGLETIVADGRPVLVGLSRKSMLGKMLGREAHERLAGSIALATLALKAGARIVRAHDVAATRDAVLVAHAVLEAGD
ncbi:MAG: dihydropteroate synthase [Steroidobacteraceae bacterium]